MSVFNFEENGWFKIELRLVWAAYFLFFRILNLFAEENAVEDAIYYLSDALRREVIELEVFLKVWKQNCLWISTMDKCSWQLYIAKTLFCVRRALPRALSTIYFSNIDIEKIIVETLTLLIPPQDYYFNLTNKIRFTGEARLFFESSELG